MILARLSSVKHSSSRSSELVFTPRSSTPWLRTSRKPISSSLRTALPTSGVSWLAWLTWVCTARSTSRRAAFAARSSRPRRTSSCRKCWGMPIRPLVARRMSRMLSMSMSCDTKSLSTRIGRLAISPPDTTTSRTEGVRRRYSRICSYRLGPQVPLVHGVEHLRRDQHRHRGPLGLVALDRGEQVLGQQVAERGLELAQVLDRMGALPLGRLPLGGVDAGVAGQAPPVGLDPRMLERVRERLLDGVRARNARGERTGMRHVVHLDLTLPPLRRVRPAPGLATCGGPSTGSGARSPWSGA